MKLFGRKSKEEANQCCCNGNCGSSNVENPNVEKADLSSKDFAISSIKVLGSGCSKCNKLEAAASDALKQLEIKTEIDHITDFAQIAAYGVMSTPALVINNKVVSYGKVLKPNEIIKIIRELE